MTAPASILGTAAYMSPEQAQGPAPPTGAATSGRSACVLYEMLTGQRAFAGDDVSDTLAAVLDAANRTGRRCRRTSPPLIRRLLRRCLEKDRTRRLADIADARLDIDDALSGPDTDAPVALLHLADA